MVPIGAILGIHRRTRYVHVVHMRGTIVRGRPEVAIRAHPVCRSAIEVTGNRRRQAGGHLGHRNNKTKTILGNGFKFLNVP